MRTANAETCPPPTPKSRAISAASCRTTRWQMLWPQSSSAGSNPPPPSSGRFTTCLAPANFSNSLGRLDSQAPPPPFRSSRPSSPVLTCLCAMPGRGVGVGGGQETAQKSRLEIGFSPEIKRGNSRHTSAKRQKLIVGGLMLRAFWLLGGCPKGGRPCRQWPPTAAAPSLAQGGVLPQTALQVPCRTE